MNRSNHNGERGGSKLSLIITLIIVGALGFAAVKIVPVYVEAYQFQDSIEAESRFALTGYPKKSVEDIRDDIYKKARTSAFRRSAKTSASTSPMEASRLAPIIPCRSI